MSEHFPSLPEAVLAAANQLGAWLAQDDLPQDPQIELVVLAGNAVIPTIDFACRLAAHHAVPLLISGGIGHSTSFLYQSVLNDPRYSTIPVDDRAEAHILADIAHQFWAIPREHIVVEDRSTNCGENARFTRQMLEHNGIAHRTGVVVQDPTMQRRTMATFAASGKTTRVRRRGTARRAVHRCCVTGVTASRSAGKRRVCGRWGAIWR